MIAGRRAAAFLDRDGVINSYVYNPEFGTVDSPSNPDQFQLVAGAGEAIALLNQMGLWVIVVSNQPGIAKGKFSPELLNRMTEKMRLEIAASGGALDAVYYCLHLSETSLENSLEGCSCRKPKPGLLLQAKEEFNIDLECSYMIGDGLTDVQAGIRAGTKTIFIGSRKCYLCEEFARQGIQPDFFAGSLLQAAGLIQSIYLGDASLPTLTCLPAGQVHNGAPAGEQKDFSQCNR
jgi:D-glycero-D-manno-heptose 1,7-bisphosphate phosphatase